MRIAVIAASLILNGFFIGFGQTASRLIPKKGLHIETSGLEWMMGSEVSFFTPDRTRHHYYFTWWEQDVDTAVTDRTVLILGSNNTAVSGTYSMEQQDSLTTTQVRCRWNGEGPAVADIQYGKIWWPWFENAEWHTAHGQISGAGLEAFHDTALYAKTSFGLFSFHSPTPFRAKKNVTPFPSSTDFDKRSQYLIFYEENIGLQHGDTVKRIFHVRHIAPEGLIPGQSERRAIPAEPLSINNIWTPPANRNVVLPKPREMVYGEGYYHIPIREAGGEEDILQSMFRRIAQLDWQITGAFLPNIQAAEETMPHPEGYRLEITAGGIGIRYQTQQGVQHALFTLAQLLEARDGQLVLPLCSVHDYPENGWRGIHLFTGPHSLALHQRMYERVLLPLKMNKAVIQCEQALWRSRPETHNSISVPLEDIKKEFGFLREHYVEPIPLIQSLGHMEWFLKPVQNRPLAVNPDYPYTLDATQAAARQAVRAIWEEAFDLLQPQTIHVGFDEIGMIGFHLDRSKEVELWEIQMAFLKDFAQEKKADLMIWGDMGLAPGEGTDALNGRTKERAAGIRMTIPKGTYIADWHYVGISDPEPYKKSLGIWKDEGFRPIASTWYVPDNIRGFVTAANQTGAGVLQTTWADFESSEKNMLINIEQFGAYVLALDYAWSGRQEMPQDIGYDPIRIWTRRFYGQPRPVSPRNGTILATHIQLRNITSAEPAGLPATVSIPVKKTTASGLAIKSKTVHILPEGTPVCSVRLYKGEEMVYEKVLRYGVEVRGQPDRRPAYACEGNTFYDFFPAPLEIDLLTVSSLHPASGLVLDQVGLVE